MSKNDQDKPQDKEKPKDKEKPGFLRRLSTSLSSPSSPSPKKDDDRKKSRLSLVNVFSVNPRRDSTSQAPSALASRLRQSSSSSSLLSSPTTSSPQLVIGGAASSQSPGKDKKAQFSPALTRDSSLSASPSFARTSSSVGGGLGTSLRGILFTISDKISKGELGKARKIIEITKKTREEEFPSSVLLYYLINHYEILKKDPEFQKSQESAFPKSSSLLPQSPSSLLPRSPSAFSSSLGSEDAKEAAKAKINEARGRTPDKVLENIITVLREADEHNQVENNFLREQLAEHQEEFLEKLEAIILKANEFDTSITNKLFSDLVSVFSTKPRSIVPEAFLAELVKIQSKISSVKTADRHLIDYHIKKKDFAKAEELLTKAFAQEAKEGKKSSDEFVVLDATYLKTVDGLFNYILDICVEEISHLEGYASERQIEDFLSLMDGIIFYLSNPKNDRQLAEGLENKEEFIQRIEALTKLIEKVGNRAGHSAEKIKELFKAKVSEDQYQEILLIMQGGSGVSRFNEFVTQGKGVDKVQVRAAIDAIHRVKRINYLDKTYVIPGEDGEVIVPGKGAINFLIQLQEDIGGTDLLEYFLLKSGVDLSAFDVVNSILYGKDSNFKLQALRLVIGKAGIDVNRPSFQGTHPLTSALIGDSSGEVDNDSLDILKLLIEAGAKVNYVNKDSSTALHAAIVGKNKEREFLLLVDNDADINFANKKEENPFHLALKFGREKIAEKLFDLDATITEGALKFVFAPLPKEFLEINGKFARAEKESVLSGGAIPDAIRNIKIDHDQRLGAFAIICKILSGQKRINQNYLTLLNGFVAFVSDAENFKNFDDDFKDVIAFNILKIISNLEDSMVIDAHKEEVQRLHHGLTGIITKIFPKDDISKLTQLKELREAVKKSGGDLNDKLAAIGAFSYKVTRTISEIHAQQSVMERKAGEESAVALAKFKEGTKSHLRSLKAVADAASRLNAQLQNKTDPQKYIGIDVIIADVSRRLQSDKTWTWDDPKIKFYRSYFAQLKELCDKEKLLFVLDGTKMDGIFAIAKESFKVSVTQNNLSALGMGEELDVGDKEKSKDDSKGDESIAVNQVMVLAIRDYAAKAPKVSFQTRLSHAVITRNITLILQLLDEDSAQLKDWAAGESFGGGLVVGSKPKLDKKEKLDKKSPASDKSEQAKLAHLLMFKITDRISKAREKDAFGLDEEVFEARKKESGQRARLFIDALKMVVVTFNKDIDINSVDDEDGYSLLHRAAEFGLTDLVEFFIGQENINLELSSGKSVSVGKTALQFAASRGVEFEGYDANYDRIISSLLAKKVNPNNKGTGAGAVSPIRATLQPGKKESHPRHFRSATLLLSCDGIIIDKDYLDVLEEWLQEYPQDSCSSDDLGKVLAQVTKQERDLTLSGELQEHFIKLKRILTAKHKAKIDQERQILQDLPFMDDDKKSLDFTSFSSPSRRELIRSMSLGSDIGSSHDLTREKVGTSLTWLDELNVKIAQDQNLDKEKIEVLRTIKDGLATQIYGKKNSGLLFLLLKEIDIATSTEKLLILEGVALLMLSKITGVLGNIQILSEDKEGKQSAPRNKDLEEVSGFVIKLQKDLEGCIERIAIKKLAKFEAERKKEASFPAPLRTEYPVENSLGKRITSAFEELDDFIERLERNEKNASSFLYTQKKSSLLAEMVQVLGELMGGEREGEDLLSLLTIFQLQAVGDMEALKRLDVLANLVKEKFQYILEEFSDLAEGLTRKGQFVDIYEFDSEESLAEEGRVDVDLNKAVGEFAGALESLEQIFPPKEKKAPASIPSSFSSTSLSSSQPKKVEAAQEEDEEYDINDIYSDDEGEEKKSKEQKKPAEWGDEDLIYPPGEKPEDQPEEQQPEQQQVEEVSSSAVVPAGVPKTNPSVVSGEPVVVEEEEELTIIN